MVALITVVSVNAQNLTGGLKLGTNFTNLVGSDISDYNLEQSFTVGGFLQLETSENFALQAGLDYNVIQLKYSEKDYHQFQIPVYGIGFIPAGAGRVLIGAGPIFGIRLNPLHYCQKTDLSAGVTLGYEFYNNIILSANYQHGLTHFTRPDTYLAGAYNQSIGVAAAYKF